jgi:hypothetical protein
MTAWDPVPYMVGGGALHSVNVFRNVAFMAAGGVEGIAAPAACEVRALEVPGGKVRVFPGTVAIENQAPGVTDEMYVGRLPVIDEVTIAPTNSSGPRTDLIVARVENPFDESGTWPAPANPETGPYIFTRVIQNVPSTITSAAQLGLGDSMIALARVTLPASTGTVLQSYITDLRTLSRVQSFSDKRLKQPTSNSPMPGTWGYWSPQADITVNCPKWATHANLQSIMSVIYGGAGGTTWNALGEVRMVILSGTTIVGTSEGTTFNLSSPPTGGIQTDILMAGGSLLPIPEAYRGTPLTVRLQAYKSGNSNVATDSGSTVSMEIEFVNQPTSNV